MKVLHITPSISRTYGGPTYSLAAYSRASIAGGAQLTIAAAQSERSDAWLSRSLPEAEVLTFRNYGNGAFFAAPALHHWLHRNGSSFDVVHVHGLLNPVSSLSARACASNGWPFAIRPFGTMSRYTFAHRRGAIKRLYTVILDRSNLRKAGAIHFTTDFERSESEWQGMTWGDRAFVIPPPWIPDRDEPIREKHVQRRTVLFLSRLHPVKNIELLFDAWPFVQKQLPDARLLIAGDGDPTYVRDLRSRAGEFGSSMSFLGYVDGEAKRHLLASADLFVLPSLHENFGIAVFQAIAAGLPVVITSEVQLSHFVREHSLGLIPHRSATALADAMVGALNDDELSERSRTHGATLLQEYFSARSVGERLLDMYRFAIAHSPA